MILMRVIDVQSSSHGSIRFRHRFFTFADQSSNRSTFLRCGGGCGGLRRRLGFGDEPPRFGVSGLMLGLLPLPLAELRGMVAILSTRLGTSTVSFGLLLMLVIWVLVTHSLETSWVRLGAMALCSRKTFATNVHHSAGLSMR